MVFIYTASQAEAKPLIRALGLVQRDATTRLRVYEGDNIALMIGGMGKVRAAAGMASLLSAESSLKNTAVLNIGICGSACEDSVGDLYHIHKISDDASKRDFYPDMFIRSGWEGNAITTFDRPVGPEADRESLKLVDMEASGFFEASSLFLSPDRIHTAKLVSDHLEGQALSASFITALIEDKVSLLTAFIESISDSTLLEKTPLLSSEEEALVEGIEKHLKLTATQCHQFKKWTQLSKLRGSTLPSSLNAYLSVMCKSKQERNHHFENIRKNLLAS